MKLSPLLDLAFTAKIKKLTSLNINNREFSIQKNIFYCWKYQKQFRNSYILKVILQILLWLEARRFQYNSLLK